MEDIIAFIDKMVQTGYAYNVDGDVFFAVDKVKEYGELSHQNPEELQVGARIEENSKKRNPLDFALWKKTEDGIQWDSPWGKGRPGWHTECVVMIGKEFGPGAIDIHGGGKDLKFPHHENEVAQSRAVNGHGLSNYWMHNGMLNLDGGKMSKSAGNTYWAKDVIADLGYEVVRWVLLSAKYRDALNYTEETINGAKTEYNKVYTAWKQAMVKALMSDVTFGDDLDEEVFGQFIEAMNDDLNTPNAYKSVFDCVKKLNQTLRTKEIDYTAVGKEVRALEKMMYVLGIEFTALHVTETDKENYRMWNEAKKNKDFETADKYRLQLMESGLL